VGFIDFDPDVRYTDYRQWMRTGLASVEVFMGTASSHR